MRIIWVAFALAVALALAGCNQVFRNTPPPNTGLHITGADPQAQELVAALNDNARRIQALDCRNVELDCTQGMQGLGLMATMVCQKPRNFRMGATVAGNAAFDIGSNDREFWYWISKGDPYQFHCSYQDLAAGRARLQFPFQPDWIMESLGMAKYNPSKPYEVVRNGANVDLVEKTVSPQGQPVRKVTRLANYRGQWQVTAHLLQDASGREICSAHVSKHHYNAATGAVVPGKINLVWPAEKITMKMDFKRITVNPNNLSLDRMADLFTRKPLYGVPSYDLARGPDSTNSLQPAGGFSSR